MARTAEEIAALKKKREEKLEEQRKLDAERTKRLRITDGNLFKALKLTDAELAGLMDKDIRRRFREILTEARKPRIADTEEPPSEAAD